MNRNGVDSEVDAMAERFSEAMSKYPIEEQLAVGLISKNVLNGCSWEFIRTNPEIRSNLQAFEKSQVCSVQKVTYNHESKIYGYLIYMKMEYLCKLLSPANNGPVSDRDIQMALKHRKEAMELLVKKIKSRYTGKIGIYCTNDSTNITINGKTYPAFAITLKELCGICQQLGYGIVFAGKVRTPADVAAREDAILERCTIAPSSNALMVEIAPLR